MHIKQIFIRTNDIFDRPGIHSSVEVETGIETVQMGNLQISEWAARKIISIVENEIQDTVEDRVKKFAEMRLEPITNLLETTDIKVEEVNND
jgi:hypothetical protein